MGHGGSWKDLFKAAGAGEKFIVRSHLNSGVDPNFQHPEYLTAPIFEAIKNGHLEIVKILIEEGNADPALVEELTVDSTLETAISYKQFDILEYLNTKLPKDERFLSRLVLVDGSNIGYGKEICRELLLKGHKVVFIYGYESTAITIQKELQSDTGNSNVDYILGSFDSMENVKTIANEVRRRFPSINTVIHNKNIWPTKLVLNDDGLEYSFMVNYLAKVILNQELLPLLKQNESSQIIFMIPECSFVEPDLNQTPVGKDFHWTRTFSKSIASSAMSFLSLVQAEKESSVSVGLVQTKGNATVIPMGGCIGRIFGMLSGFFYSQPSASEIQSWLSTMEAVSRKNTHGKVAFDEKHSDPTLQIDEISRKQLEQWTIDFLSRSNDYH